MSTTTAQIVTNQMNQDRETRLRKRIDTLADKLARVEDENTKRRQQLLTLQHKFAGMSSARSHWKRETRELRLRVKQLEGELRQEKAKTAYLLDRIKVVKEGWGRAV